MRYEYEAVIRGSGHRMWLAAANRRSITQTMTLTTVQEMSDLFGVLAPQVNFRPMNSGSYYRAQGGKPPRLHLPDLPRKQGGALTLGMVLHEFAHHLLWCLSGRGYYPGHGAEFVGWLDRLLEEFYA